MTKLHAAYSMTHQKFKFEMSRFSFSMRTGIREFILH